MAGDRIRELEQRIADLERDTPQARQAQYAADLALADLAESETHAEYMDRCWGPAEPYSDAEWEAQQAEWARQENAGRHHEGETEREAG